MTARADAIEMEVVHQTLAGIVGEMQESLFATGYSVAIRETHDASCAVTDPNGGVLAQHTVLPLHLGAFPACVEAVLGAFGPADLDPEDAFVVNHPYEGGSPHASDMAVLVPVFVDGRLFAFAGAIAHKTDIGGLVPGSNSGQAREVFHEGLLLPAVRLAGRDGIHHDVERIIRANSRTPELVAGDLRGQLGAARLGARRVEALCGKLGREVVEEASARLLAWTESRVRAAVRGWPDGAYTGEASLVNDSINGGRPVTVRVRLTIDADRLHADFSESADQVDGPYNIRPHLVRAVCAYAITCLVSPDLPSNAGIAATLTTRFREGSVLSPRFPAPVNTYLPIALLAAEAILDAFAPAVPRARVAFSSHGGSSVTGTLAHRRPDGSIDVQYEILAGAMGARADDDGVSATSVHVRNASLTPIEVLESEYPVEVVRSELGINSGGAGRFRGGLGLIREYRFLSGGRRTARGGRDLAAARGRDGGRAGGRATVRLRRTGEGERELGAGDEVVELAAGDAIRFEMGGGGGYGDPLTRPAEHVLADVREGYVSAEGARNDYGVVVSRGRDGWQVDAAATSALRAELLNASDRRRASVGTEVNVAKRLAGERSDVRAADGRVATPESGELWYSDEGTGDAVVFLHGLADTHDLWKNQVPVLRGRYRTIAVDHFGHGRSPLPSGTLTTEVMADGVARLIERLGIAPCVLVGLSMGGGIAQVLTLRHPGLVRGLVLVSTSSEFATATRERFLARAATAEREGMAAVVDASVPRWFTEEFTAAHPDVVEAKRRTFLANDPAAFAAASRANAERGWSDRLAEIRCPVLYVGGDRDPADAVRSAGTYRDRLTDSRIHVLPGLSHLVPVEAPERFNALLVDFLDELDRRRS